VDQKLNMTELEWQDCKNKLV